MARKTFALALGGGGARGWAHIGVLRTLSEAGLSPDIIVGTSIGAIVGGHYSADRLAELEAFVRPLTRRSVLGYLDVSFSGSGLITGQRLFDRFDDHLKGLTIEKLPTRFVAIATELSTGHEVWLRRGRITDAVRASSAIPGIVRPVRMDNRWLIDGSLVNPIPVSVCRALGAHAVIAVSLVGDSFGRGGIVIGEEGAGLAAAPSDMVPPAGPNGRGALQLIHRQLFGQQPEAAPAISSVILNSFSIVHDRIARARLMGDPPDLIIAPELAGIGVFDFHRAEEMIARGEAAVRPQLAAIERYVKGGASPPSDAEDLA